MKWLRGWSNCFEIVIDKDQIDAALTWFPVPIHISDSCGPGSQDLSAIFDELGANSLKLAVTSDDGLTELYVEIEKWDNGNEEAWLWVSKTGWNISDSADTIIYLYYDNNHVDNSSYVGVIGSVPGKQVWDNDFAEVVHGEDGVDNAHVTGSKTGTSYAKKGANEPIEFAAGKVGAAQDFDGSDDYINLGNDAGFNPVKITLEAIGYQEDANPSYRGLFLRGAWDSTYMFYVVNPTELRFFVKNAASVVKTLSVTRPTDNAFHHLMAVFDGSLGSDNLEIFGDGISLGTDDLAGDAKAVVGDTKIGAGHPGGEEIWDGKLEEIRISNQPRSAAYAKAVKQGCWDNLLTFTALSLTQAKWGFSTWA